MRREFVVELPHGVATERRAIKVEAFRTTMHNGTSYLRKSHTLQRTYVKKEITDWLKHSVRRGFSVGNASTNPVSFWFDDKAKAALFKLFWYP